MCEHRIILIITERDPMQYAAAHDIYSRKVNLLSNFKADNQTGKQNAHTHTQTEIDRTKFSFGEQPFFVLSACSNASNARQLSLHPLYIYTKATDCFNSQRSVINFEACTGKSRWRYAFCSFIKVTKQLGSQLQCVNNLINNTVLNLGKPRIICSRISIALIFHFFPLLIWLE